MLELDTILVKERVGLMKMSDTYDLYDPASGTSVGVCQEIVPWWVHLLRFAVNKRLLPTTVKVLDNGQQEILEIRRGFSLLSPKLQVLDGNGNLMGYLKAKLFTIGTSFRVLDASDVEIATLKGDWKGWNFRLVNPMGAELGTLSKKWAGIGKELFTSADNYVISLAPDVAGRSSTRRMLLAAALAVDTCYKEKK